MHVKGRGRELTLLLANNSLGCKYTGLDQRNMNEHHVDETFACDFDDGQTVDSRMSICEEITSQG